MAGEQFGLHRGASSHPVPCPQNRLESQVNGAFTEEKACLESSTVLKPSVD
jgi:hypothetical protein